METPPVNPALELAGSWQLWPGAAASPAPFVNHDCLELPLPVLDWDLLRHGLRGSCGHTRLTRTLRCAARIENWQEHVLRVLRPLAPTARQAFQALDRLLPAAYTECRLGVVVLYVARVLMCLAAGDIECYVQHSPWISAELYKTPLTVVMGTDWPIFALLNSYDWSYPGIPRGNDYDCVKSNRTLDWPRLLAALQDDERRPEASWWLDILRYTFDNKLAMSMYLSSFECLYGVYVLNMVKAMWSADTESSAFRIYEPYVQWVHYESLHLLGASGWRIFELLHHFGSLRRHSFRLDFTAQELGGLPWRAQGPWLQALPKDQHLALLQAPLLRSPSLAFSDAAEALRAALRAEESDSRLVYITMVYGSMNRYIAGWALRLRTVGLGSLVMATLDDEAFALCTRHHGLCVRAGISVLNKYTLLLLALQMGLDVMWLDFDIFLVQHPTKAIEKAAVGSDLLMGYDLESDCLCNGFFFIRSSEKTHRWLFEMVRWLYDHPYEHDQRAIGAFLNYTERISISEEELPPIPRWHVFDEENSFINYGSWLGDFDQLVLVHFVDGSAFSLYGRPSWDPSIPLAKKQQVEASESGAESGPATSTMDEFYDLEAAAQPQLDGRLRALLQSKVRAKPEKKQKCGILPMVVSAHPGYGWLAEHGSRAQVPEWLEEKAAKEWLQGSKVAVAPGQIAGVDPGCRGKDS
ncbi:unnamed protein product, partial [Effrenium voratum]